MRPGWGSADSGTIAGMYYTALGKKHGFTLETPIEEFSEQALDELLYGTGDEPLELSVSRISGGVMRQSRSRVSSPIWNAVTVRPTASGRAARLKK